MRMQALIWIFSMTSMFAFLSIFWWALQRRREREAYYRYELARQLLERTEGTQNHEFLDWLKEEETLELRRRRDGFQLGGLVLIATGAGFLMVFHGKSSEESMIGWLPLFIGISMLVHLVLTHRRKRHDEDASG